MAFPVAKLSEFIGVEAEECTLSPSLNVMDYTHNGSQKSLYLDWRTSAEMQGGIFSYSEEFLRFVREQYDHIVIIDEANLADILELKPDNAESSHRVIKSRLEESGEIIYTIMFDTSKHISHEN